MRTILAQQDIVKHHGYKNDKEYKNREADVYVIYLKNSLLGRSFSILAAAALN